MTRDAETSLRILVVGAGIAGLSMVRMLTRNGHRVTLAERSPRIRTEGAGLVLPSSAIGVLDRLGMEARAIAHPLRRVSILGADGRVRMSAGGRVAFRRADLISALAAGVDVSADVRLGIAAAVIDNSAERVRCEVGGRPADFDLVVGADGAGSETRAVIAPDVGIRASGQICWRGIVDGQWRADRATEMWNGSQRVGIVPLSDGHSYVYVVRSSGSSPHLGDAVSGLIGAEAEAAGSLAELPEADLLRHELSELEHPVWGAGRVVLIGDAAHAMTSNLGLGASLALKDAEVLSRNISHSDDSVRLYARRRRLAVVSSQLASRAIGGLAHSPAGPVKVARHLLGFA